MLLHDGFLWSCGGSSSLCGGSIHVMVDPHHFMVVPYLFGVVLHHFVVVPIAPCLLAVVPITSCDAVLPSRTLLSSMTVFSSITPRLGRSLPVKGNRLVWVLGSCSRHPSSPWGAPRPTPALWVTEVRNDPQSHLEVAKHLVKRTRRKAPSDAEDLRWPPMVMG